MHTAAPSSTLHLMGRFDDPYTGAERDLLDARKLLAGRRPVRLWSDVPPHRFHAEQGVQGIKLFAHQFPRDGVLLVAGVHVTLGGWLKYTHFDRVVLFYNLASHERLFAMLQALRDMTRCVPEVVFVSRALQLAVGLHGRVVNSLIDLEPYLMRSQAGSAERPPQVSPRPFTVGRVSRDVPGKHHAADPSLYRMLAANGIRVRIMGGTCLSNELRGVEGVELLPAGAESVTDFYRSLDVFFYRTGTMVEAYGRVVLEAMASGLPVVASRMGGYAEAIRPGVSGFLIHSQEEAYDALMHLMKQPLLACQMGVSARCDALARHGPQANEALVNSWLLS